jgi:hypothetical protein
MRKALIGLVCSTLLWVSVGFPIHLEASKDSTGVYLSPVQNLSNASDTATDSTKGELFHSHGVMQHSFNHREQVIAGSIFMLCLTLMLVSVNNYNPQKK